ncbi:MAG TPA: metallophosphoesterase [Stellaceae bacterium]|nr:metallophosphoesterase [Stellaceae bacterium]
MQDRSTTTRRKAMQCLMLGSAGVLWTVAGGVPRGRTLVGDAQAAEPGTFTFAQVSDTHIGFKNPINPDPNATLSDALARITAAKPDFMLHTGDVTHLSKPEEFDAADQLLKTAKLETFHVPGEHDVIGDDGKQFFGRFGRSKAAGGWYSFDKSGLHFVGLINVVNLKAGGQGSLGTEQLEWLEDDLRGKSASTPIVVFAHMPLWSVYPQWGWGTDDADAAMAYLKRFGSVTVLNGHIHQVIQKVEGNITCRTAYSTAFPQAAPGAEGGSPGPLKVPAEKLRAMLGVREVEIVAEKASFSDASLAS